MTDEERERLEDGRRLARDLDSKRLAALFEGSWMWGLGGLPAPDEKSWMIPPTIVSDGPCGLRTERDGKTLPAPLYPTPAAMACTWDPKLEEDVGKAVARDARARKVDVVLAPGVNIKRNPRCGRCFEYFSEDPLLAGRMGTAYVRGVQSQHVGACLKHYACNSQETDRFTVDAIPDECTFMDIYFPAFEAVVKDADPWCVMTAYNKFRGGHCESSSSLFDLLRTRLNYTGVTMSDWGAVEDSVSALNTGLNVQMPGAGGEIAKHVYRAIVEDQRLSEKARTSAGYVLALDLKAKAARALDQEKARPNEIPAALRGARESIVLLENKKDESGKPALPLSPNIPVAVIGSRAAHSLYQGNGSSRIEDVRADKVLSVLDELKSRLGVTYCKGYNLGGKVDEALEDEAIRVVERIGTCICVLGADDYDDSEGADRQSVSLAPNQLHLAKKLIESNAKTIFVVQGGSAIDVSPLSKADGLIFQYLGGSYASQALKEVIIGEVNPSGHLAETLPIESEVPLDPFFPAPADTERYLDGEYVGYRWYDSFDRPVAYPFGYGLSYSDFSFSNLSVSRFDPEKGLTVTLSVHNSGPDGSEVVQVYLRPENPLKGKPVHWLGGFEKVRVLRGETRNVSINIPARAFALWDADRKDYFLPVGNFSLEVGDSSRDIKLIGATAIPECSRSEAFEIGAPVRPTIQSIDGKASQSSKPKSGHIRSFDRNSPMGEVLGSRWLLRKIKNGFVKNAYKSAVNADGILTEQAKAYAESPMGYPMRLAMVSGLSERMIDGLILIANHHGFRGLFSVLLGLRNRLKVAYKKALRCGL